MSRNLGFTLIETIIAMSLLTLLMVIVWTMFGIYTKLETKGVAAAAESSLVRAIDRQFRDDLLHTIAVDRQRAVAVDQESDPAGNQFPLNGYLVGTETDLHFVVSVETNSKDAVDPIRVLSYQPRSVIEEQNDDQRESNEAPTVEALEIGLTDQYATPLGIDRRDRSWRTYWKDHANGDSLQATLNTNRPSSLDADDFMQVGQNSSDDDAQVRRFPEAADATDEISEIQRLSFRYFDGAAWRSQWDSTVLGRLPIAIELGFDLRINKDNSAAQQEAENFQSGAGRPQSTSASIQADRDRIYVSAGQTELADVVTEYRCLVSIPAAAETPKRDSVSDDVETPGSLLEAF